MNVHEYQAKEFFQEAGIPVAAGKVAASVAEALKIAQDIGFPVVLKAQVLTGGRGKAGGVKVVKNKEELQKTFPAIAGLTIKGYKVEKILVVKAVDIKKEFYAAVTVDGAQDDVVLIASPAGGIDIEEVAKTQPEQIHKFYFKGEKAIDLARWKEFIKGVCPDPTLQEPITEIFKKLLHVFYAQDCSLAEINPLVITADGSWCAVDAKMTFDDNALFRHQEHAELQDLKYEDTDELEAKKHGLSFVKLQGNVGCIVNGAGLAMATMDVIKLTGGNPANFLDVGGSSSPEKVLNALKIILKNSSVKSILINIFGGITRCDDIAKGILQAREELKISAPLVVRLAGTNEEEAKALLAEAGITAHSAMRAAVQEAVALAKK